jgi:hypothetical protein
MVDRNGSGILETACRIAGHTSTVAKSLVVLGRASHGRVTDPSPIIASSSDASNVVHLAARSRLRRNTFRQIVNSQRRQSLSGANVRHDLSARR